MGYLRKMQILYTAKIKKLPKYGAKWATISLGHKLGDIFNELNNDNIYIMIINNEYDNNRTPLYTVSSYVDYI